MELAPVSIVLNIWKGDEPSSLTRSVNSITKQNHIPDEVIVVVDGRIDRDLEEVITKFVEKSDISVKLIHLPTTAGLWNARNHGISVAKNELIALHDADDVMHPDRLGAQTKKILADKVDVLGSPVFEFDSDTGKILGLRHLGAGKSFIKKMLQQNIVNHSSVMLRRSAVMSVGGYRSVFLAEDYDLWLRLLKAGFKFSTTESVLQAFSVDKNLMKRRGGIKFILSEILLHQSVKSFNELRFFRLYLRLLMRLVFRLSPSFVRSNYYKTVQTQISDNFEINLDDFLSTSPYSLSSMK